MGLDVLSMVVDVDAETSAFERSLKQACKDAKLDFDVKGGFVKGFKKSQEEVKGIFAKTVAEGVTVGLGKADVKALAGKMQGVTDAMEKSLKNIFKMELGMKKTGLSDEKKKTLQALHVLETEKLARLEKRLKLEKVSAEKIIKRQKLATDEATRLAERTAAEMGEEIGEGLAKSFSHLKSGGFADMFKGAGKWAAGRGQLMKDKGDAGGSAIPGGDTFNKTIGTLLKKLGPAIMGIGALVAGIAALAAVFFEADSKAKELNKTLLDSGMTAGELTNDFGEMSDTLDKVRNTFTHTDGAWTFNRKWGTTAKDNLEILGEYAKAGVTLKALENATAKSADEMDRLRDASAATLTYARLLGTTNTEMAETFATKMQEMGTNIDGVSKSLSAVHSAAMESGFGVKRFFNMVLQATSGMTMYNVRMEEAAGLLIRFGKILGAKQGGDFLQQMSKGFGEMSTQEKYKKVLVTGQGTTQGVYKRSASHTADDFLRKFNEQMPSGKAAGEDMATALSKSGIKVNFSDSKSLIADLSKLNAGDQAKLLATAREGGNDELVQQLTNLMQVAQGVGGGTGKMAMNLGGLDMGGKLAMTLQQGNQMLGKPLHMITDPAEMMAFENIFGIQGEQLEALKRVSQGIYGSWDVLQESLKSGKKLSHDEMVAQVKAHGAYFNGTAIIAAKLDETGKNIVDGTGKPITDLGDYMQSSGDAFKGVTEAGLSKDQQLALQQVTATTEMSKILEQGVEWLLGQINDAVQAIWDIMDLGGLDSTEKANKAELLQQSRKTISDLRERESGAGRVVGEAERALNAAQTPQDKATAKAAVDAAQAELKKIQVQKAVAQDNFRRAKEFKSGKGIGSKSLEEMRAEIQAGRTPAELKKNLVESGVLTADEAAAREAEATAQVNAKYGVNSAEELYKKTYEANKGKYSGSRPGGARGGEDAWTAEDAASAAVAQYQAELKMSQAQGVAGELTSSEFDKIQEESRKDDAQKAQAYDKRFYANPKFGAALANAQAAFPFFQKALKEQADTLAEAEAGKDLTSILASAGVKAGEITPQQQAEYAKGLAHGTIPKGLQDLLGRATGSGKTVLDDLTAKGYNIQPAAKDFIMHIGSDGQVKFQQRIDRKDQVAVASMPGGGIDQALSGRRGGGGMVVVNHNYNDGEGVRKSWRSLQAARALG